MTALRVACKLVRNLLALAATVALLGLVAYLALGVSRNRESARQAATAPRSDSVATATAGPAPAWLARVNAHRALAGLGPVAEDPALSARDRAHAAYMVANGRHTHAEEPGTPGYSVDGQLAGRGSNVLVWSDPGLDDAVAVDWWMTAPFHALGLLDPQLRRVGFGAHRDPGRTPYAYGAALDVIGGVDPGVPARYPVFSPGDGATALLRDYRGGEVPDPLGPCPGYAAPTGLPLTLQVGPVRATRLDAHALSRDGAPVEHCAYDALGYVGPDAAQTRSGREALASRWAVVVVPRRPLEPGTYRVGVALGPTTYAWGFVVAP